MTYVKGGFRILIMLLIALACAIFMEAYNKDYYESFQESYAISQETGKSPGELKKINQDLISYLKRGDISLLNRHFSQNECLHMMDVYGLFKMTRLILGAALLMYALILLKIIFFKETKKAKLGAGLVIVFFLLALIAISAYFNWDKTFIAFHKIFFKNDLWLMDPRKDLMIQMLPAPFFIGMAKAIAVRFIINMSILLAIYKTILYLSGKRIRK